MDDVAERDDGESAADDADGEQDEEDSRDVQGEALLGWVRALRNGPGSCARPRSILAQAACRGPIGQNGRGMFRLIAGVFLGLWLAAAFAFTLREAHPLAGQVVTDNPTPFATIRIYLDNLDSAFWISQAIGNLLLLFPLGLFGPIAVPWLDRWWRVLLVALVLSSCIEAAQLWIPDRSADVDDVLLNALGALLGYWLLILVRLRPSAGEPLLGPD
jgi:hypothetical protein